MVVKLTGKINGNPVTFDYQGGDTWGATIPPELNGIYIVALTAWDEAGNMSYVVKYIVTIDLSSLSVRLKPYPYQSEIECSDYHCVLLCPEEG